MTQTLLPVPVDRSFQERLEANADALAEAIEVNRHIVASPDGLNRVPLPLRPVDVAHLFDRSTTWVKNIAADINDLDVARDSNHVRQFYPDDVCRIRRKTRSKPVPPVGARAQVVAVINQKGGVGKTTTSVNLAQDLARSGYRVLMVDLDGQASATASFLVGDTAIAEASAETKLVNPASLPIGALDTIGRVLLRDPNIEPAKIHEITRHTHWPNVDIVLSSYDFDEVVMRLVNELVDELYERRRGGEIPPSEQVHGRLMKALHEIPSELYDVVLLDCSPSLSHMTTLVMAAADGLIIPSPPRNYDIESLLGFLTTTASWLDVFNNRDTAEEDRLRTPAWHCYLLTQVQRSSESEDRIMQLLRQVFPEIIKEEVARSEILERSGAGAATIYEVQTDGNATATRGASAMRRKLAPIHSEILGLIGKEWKRWADANSAGGNSKEGGE